MAKQKQPATKQGFVFVGMMPSRGSDPDDPLGKGGDSGRRLAELMGLTLDAFHRRYARFNLNRYYSERFDPVEARHEARTILTPGMNRGDHAVLLGREVVEAFGFRDVAVELGWLKWWTCEGRGFVAVPHPSGLNRWWNDPKNAEAARELLVGVEEARAHGQRAYDESRADERSPFRRREPLSLAVWRGS